MKEFLLPKKIRSEISAGNLSKDKAADMLISLIEGSDDINTRVNSIKVLENLEFKSKRVYKTLENYLISDEDALLRATAAEYIIINYLDDSISPLNWVIQHDRSPLVLKVFFDYQKRFEEERFDMISERLKSWKNEFASTLGIVPEESNFFFDLEALFAEDKKNYQIDPKSYKNFQDLADFKGGEPWLLINTNHIEGLNFNYYKWKFIKDNIALINSFSKLIDLDFYINSLKKYSYKYILISIIPESIGSLTHLKKLILKKNGLEKVPSSIKRLIRLKELDLSHNELKKVPQIIKKLKSLEKLNLKHNKIKRIPESLLAFLNSLENFYS
ncbi:MAG: leucine-rich repeat domain-containing protein [Promethearchaeota archaeon]|jgi:hypothetical protein